MIYSLGIIEKMNDFMKPFKDWVFKNHDNPLLWLSFFMVGALIFGVIYQKLQKEK